MTPAGAPTGVDTGDGLLAKPAGALRRLARERFGVAVREEIPLAGDASDRRYLRLRHPEASPPSSVGMILSAPFAEDELPFLNVRAHFEGIGIPVPAVLGMDPAAGALLLEDAGERTLEEVWEAGGWEAASPLYLKAVDLLAVLQRGPEAADPASPHMALRRAFDPGTFARELHHTRRYAFEALLGARAPEAEFTAPFAALAEALCRQPFRLTHRDYHSRNLMAPEGGGISVLDFQDARLGPAVYDLASLVFDSYAALPESGRSLLAERFRQGAGALYPDPEVFRADLALAGLQRNLKAIGTFAFQKVERNTSRYLRHIPPTVAHIRRHLALLPDWAELAAGLGPHLDALEAVNEENRS
ncbi:MAG: phosphotransferase [bacterium]